MKVFVLFVAIAAAACQCQGDDQGDDHGVNFQMFPLRTKSGLGGHYIPEVTCKSWMLGVEAHNIIGFSTIPKDCIGYIGNYLLGHQYRSDSKTVCREAYHYVKTLNITNKDAWVFDIDETALSNLPYYAHHGFGYALYFHFNIYIYMHVVRVLMIMKHDRAEPYDPKTFDEWVFRGVAPALPESLKLYRKLVSLGVKIVFITGRALSQRDVTASNLKKVGYYKWDKLITE